MIHEALNFCYSPDRSNCLSSFIFTRRGEAAPGKDE